MSQDFISRRSFEIAFAVFRVASLVRHPRLRAALENAAVDLYVGNTIGVGDAISCLERAVRLAEAIGEIKAVNAAVIYRELGNLNTAILQQTQDEIRQKDSDAEIEHIFSKPPMVIEERDRRQETNGKGQGTNSNGINSAIRQSNIIAFIRQCGNTAMKELIAAFPDVSERTLRYDLQKLCEQGVIDRVGNGGPGSYYKARIHADANPEQNVTG